MIKLPPLTIMYRPAVTRDFLDRQPEMSTMIANAVSGIFIVLTASLAPQIFTALLIICMSVLFGPLVGFIMSAAYSSTAWFVGRKMGGKAERKAVYRFVAWSFLIISSSFLLYSITSALCKNADQMITILLSIPSLMLFIIGLLSYFTNMKYLQQFTHIKNALYTVYTLAAVFFIGFGIKLLYHNYSIYYGL